MSPKYFVVAISISLLAFSADAQDRSSHREFAANPIHRNLVMAEVSNGQTVLTRLRGLAGSKGYK